MIRGCRLQSAAAKLDLAQADLQTQIANAVCVFYFIALPYLGLRDFLFSVAEVWVILRSRVTARERNASFAAKNLESLPSLRSDLPERLKRSARFPAFVPDSRRVEQHFREM